MDHWKHKPLHKFINILFKKQNKKSFILKGVCPWLLLSLAKPAVNLVILEHYQSNMHTCMHMRMCTHRAKRDSMHAYSSMHVCGERQVLRYNWYFRQKHNLWVQDTCYQNHKYTFEKLLQQNCWTTEATKPQVSGFFKKSCQFQYTMTRVLTLDNILEALAASWITRFS